ncbi:hypothetical protein HOB87_08420 [Candidatus Woesearchaeota archaeon]|mgnify:FL=1|jgi:hypothetical protein|nr:hypothetical protein [Candidatus Woesearchaeota archaeon]MBT7558278.1 hypothetical protein [Candidatus Woesearchaeota archaeon]
MYKLGGLTQDKLNEIWGGFDSNNSESLAQKLIDDAVEQVMSIKTTEGLAIVIRKDNGDWTDMS